MKYWKDETLETLQAELKRLEAMIAADRVKLEEKLGEIAKQAAAGEPKKLTRLLKEQIEAVDFIKYVTESTEFFKGLIRDKIKEIETQEPKYEVIKAFVEKWRETTTAWYLDKKENGFEGDDKHILALLNESPEMIERIIEREALARLVKLIHQIKDKTGEVIECHLTTSPSLEGFDGKIKGEKRTVYINTIYAGGWNIQKLHFRVLIK